MNLFDENPVLKALLDRRSIRKFTADPVPRGQLRAVLTAGIYAPRGLGKDAMRFMVFEHGGHNEPDERSAREREIFAAKCPHSAAYVRSAPVFIALFMDKERTYHPAKDYQGMGACMENMLLAAHALGLGAVWIGELVSGGAEIAAALELDARHYELQAGICLGYPAEQRKRPDYRLEEYLLRDYPESGK